LPILVTKKNILLHALVLLMLFSMCRKDQLLNIEGAQLGFSQDSVLFDTVFTTIGSATKNIRVINNNDQRIRITNITLQNGPASQFKLNVDGTPGSTFSDVEIAAHDSMYIFVQVKVDPTNANSPLIVSDAITFNVNGGEQKVILEAWGQDAYYHYPNKAIIFKDGTYLPYSRIDTADKANVTWKKDKPHVIYGYVVVDSSQKLTIPAGTKIYLNYKAGLWVYRFGELKVLGQKGNEVIFQGARREKELSDDPGQWDRIWINEGSVNNVIDYAIIKNGFVGIQAENLNFDTAGVLKLTNTKIQNMSHWGIYGLGYVIDAGNTVVSNCQEHCLNLMYFGSYRFVHCDFVNFWEKEKPREKTTINLNNYTDTRSLPAYYWFGNCIIDGKKENELTLDFKNVGANTATLNFSSCWLKTDVNINDPTQFTESRSSSTASLEYKDATHYNFEPVAGETRIKGFTHTNAVEDMKLYPKDIMGTYRKVVATGGITAGAYEIP
jgi:hypothetical protein